MNASTDTLSLHPDILFRAVDDEGVVVDQRQPEVMVINKQALEILELIRETRSKKAVLAALTRQYQEDQTTITRDLDEFIETLKEREMLV